jgi:hypothetical protein
MTRTDERRHTEDAGPQRARLALDTREDRFDLDAWLEAAYEDRYLADVDEDTEEVE